LSLLHHLVLASPEHHNLAKTLQATVITFREKLRNAIETGWRDREALLLGVIESGGTGLGGNVDKAREVVKPVVAEWKGLGVLGR